MNQLGTKAIILSRVNYGEADRIITMITPDYGKQRLMAKGVRKVKSKLAGGIELFSVSNISFIQGRGEVGTLVSTRLIEYYSNIVKDLTRTNLGYEIIKILHRTTEDTPESEYFSLLEQAFIALNDLSISLEVINLWFAIQLLRLGGQSLNLQTDSAGNRLMSDSKYNFDFDSMIFTATPQGRFNANDIKLLRLGFSGYQPSVLQQVQGIDQLIDEVSPTIQTMLNIHLRLDWRRSD
jgi:DNA repair protein RecO